MPNVIQMNIKEAKKILKELGLEVEINGEEEDNKEVIDQLPKKGIQVQKGTKVTLYL